MSEYSKTIREGVDKLNVTKYAEKDGGWVTISMQIHDFQPIIIELRSKQAFDDLYYMLTQIKDRFER